ncbi:hypothetical protein D9758_004493 [Tetrapyrgos nigripes]|uniref:Protein kinase domain-containing protein n=1 Tax=Tetrapyrgos nigripes TaxID=182062 RepID=A0A8H5GMZ6_9AGAR|nr:hypothetical protein D9758_004493 [Tetrapyrgos nigripes]
MSDNDLSTTELADRLIKEAYTYKELAQHPHQNICNYHGIRLQGDFMTGLCLKRYSKTLQQCVDDGDELDVESVLQGIRKVSQGDINPSNIMLDYAESGGPFPVIVDFDSCRKQGEPNDGKVGTEGRYEPSKPAEYVNDEVSLGYIARWLRTRS